MRKNTEELDRPTEWLRRLREEHHLYRRLLADAGSLASAAHRLARARCRVQPVSASVPTMAELAVAAREIARFAGLDHPVLPAQIIADCEDAGLVVIVPISASAA